MSIDITITSGTITTLSDIVTILGFPITIIVFFRGLTKSKKSFDTLAEVINLQKNFLNNNVKIKNLKIINYATSQKVLKSKKYDSQ